MGLNVPGKDDVFGERVVRKLYSIGAVGFTVESMANAIEHRAPAEGTTVVAPEVAAVWKRPLHFDAFWRSEFAQLIGAVRPKLIDDFIEGRLELVFPQNNPDPKPNPAGRPRRAVDDGLAVLPQIERGVRSVTFAPGTERVHLDCLSVGIAETHRRDVETEFTAGASHGNLDGHRITHDFSAPGLNGGLERAATQS